MHWEVIFDVPNLTQRIQKLQQESESPDFWADSSRAEKTLRELSALKNRLEPLQSLQKTYQEIQEFLALLRDHPDPEVEKALINMAQGFLAELERFETATLLSGEHDPSDAIVEINAGAGGTEACDWAQMLYRMYTRWADRHNYKVTLLSETPGEVTGYRSVSFEVAGPYAYGYLKAEHGVHRLVRISPFDASGKRHTSFAMVSVLPEVPEGQVHLKPEDIKVETFRSSGAGGQHVNKTESAVRITHIPTGIVVACQNERSQHKNKTLAMKILTARLAEWERNKTEAKLRQLKGDLTSADWGRQIRSYVLQPYSLVKDLRTNWETSNVLSVLDGELDDFINAYLRQSPPKLGQNNA